MVTGDPEGLVAAHPSALADLVGDFDQLEGGIVTALDAAGAAVMVVAGARRTQTGLRWIRPDLDERGQARRRLIDLAGLDVRVVGA